MQDLEDYFAKLSLFSVLQRSSLVIVSNVSLSIIKRVQQSRCAFLTVVVYR